ECKRLDYGKRLKVAKCGICTGPTKLIYCAEEGRDQRTADQHRRIADANAKVLKNLLLSALMDRRSADQHRQTTSVSVEAPKISLSFS
ncbi:hypothetical protein HAX54_003206, partial [Datura stramonium]|nr:hypothetical protein [Datura stramonium]